jgi:palmitoyltransferase ZDHHC1/11
MSASRKVRKNGFDTPISMEQLGASALMISSSILSYGFYVPFSNSLAWSIILPIYSCLLLLVLIFWTLCEVIDPADDGPYIKVPSQQVTHTTKNNYCRLCNKTIPGLDHHCNWLNTCVGRKNYAYFLMLSSIGTAFFLSQVILALILVCYSPWQSILVISSSANTIGFKIYSAIVIALGAIGAFSFGSLLSFHIYLNWYRISTYEYMSNLRMYGHGRPINHSDVSIANPTSA